MVNNSFYKWLNESLHTETSVPCPPDLNDEENAFVKHLQECFTKSSQYRQYAKAYLENLEGSETIYEGSINTFSAIIKIIQLTSKKDRSLNVNALCKNVIEIISDELEMENCSIMLKEKDGENLEMIAGKGKGDKYSKVEKQKDTKKTKPGEGIAGTVFNTGEHIFIPDVSSDSRYKSSPKDDVSITSILVAPIIANNETIGVINFSHPQRSGVFDRNSINFMLMLTNFIGQVLTMVELQQHIEEWNIRLQKEVAEKTHELVLQNRKLERIAVTDPLTSLYNRRFFFTRLKEEFDLFSRYDETFSFLMIDLDNLKGINDTYGHDMGDTVIKRIARTFKIIGRKGDVIGRIGGDEFGYIFLKGDENEACAFAERIQEAIRNMKIKDSTLKPTLSIGVATVKSSDFKEHLDLYRAADAAVYEAKKKRNTIYRFSQVKEKPPIS